MQRLHNPVKLYIYIYITPKYIPTKNVLVTISIYLGTTIVNITDHTDAGCSELDEAAVRIDSRQPLDIFGQTQRIGSRTGYSPLRSGHWWCCPSSGWTQEQPTWRSPNASAKGFRNWAASCKNPGPQETYKPSVSICFLLWCRRNMISETTGIPACTKPTYDSLYVDFKRTVHL